MSTPKSININFRDKPTDLELYNWFMAQLGPVDDPTNRSRLGRELLTIAKDAQLHANAQGLTVAEWMARAENAINLLSQIMPGMTDETLAKAIAEKMKGGEE